MILNFIIVFILYIDGVFLLHLYTDQNKKMKNKLCSKILSWLLDVLPKGLAVFGIVAGAYYVYAANINFPAVDPYPVTGLVGQFVGINQDGYYTNTTGSYEKMNQGCSQGTYWDFVGNVVYDNTGAHICSVEEMIRSYNVGVPMTTTDYASPVILNGGGGGATFANDCNGWTAHDAIYEGAPVYGTVWSFVTDSASVITCDNLYESNPQFAGGPVWVACCQ
jgi:hypothetical protein